MTRTKKIIFLGSNPSNASPFNDPFTHCKSRIVLEQWLPALGLTLDDVEFANVSNEKTPNNRPLRRHEIDVEYPRLRALLAQRAVVTLGKTAELAAGFVAFTLSADQKPVVINLPHPSGRNRVLNDKAKVAEILQKARQKLNEVDT